MSIATLLAFLILLGWIAVGVLVCAVFALIEPDTPEDLIEHEGNADGERGVTQ